LVALLGGCAYLPEYVDPIDWADSANEWVTGSILGEESGDDIASAEGSSAPGEEDPFPDLESVPDERPSVRSLEQRENLANDLLADRAGARYEDEPSTISPNPLEGREVPAVTPEIEEISGLDPSQLDRLNSSAPSPANAELTTQGGGETIQLANRKLTEVMPNVSQNSGEQEFVIPPPAVPEFPEWSSVEEYFDKLFKSSGGWGSSAGHYASAVVPSEKTEAMLPEQQFMKRHAAVIYFGHGSSKLSNADKEVLGEVAKAVTGSSGRVSVVGHASSRTKTNDVLKHNVANYETSLARAESVAAELILQGVPSSRVSVHAMADGQPDYSEATRLGEAGNRRANIYIEY